MEIEEIDLYKFTNAAPFYYNRVNEKVKAMGISRAEYLKQAGASVEAVHVFDDKAKSKTLPSVQKMALTREFFTEHEFNLLVYAKCMKRGSAKDFELFEAIKLDAKTKMIIKARRKVMREAGKLNI